MHRTRAQWLPSVPAGSRKGRTVEYRPVFDVRCEVGQAAINIGGWYSGPRGSGPAPYTVIPFEAVTGDLIQEKAVEFFELSLAE
jgi:hypothetical protein